MTDPGILNLHAFLPQSYANGPGSRAVVWFQGCTLNCDGCFNPATHSGKPNILKSPADLANDILIFKNIEGISISGGEPFDQAEGLAAFLQTIRNSSKLTIILFSGYTFEKILEMTEGEEILKNIDVLIAGPFDKSKLLPENLAGSSNKTYHFFTEKYSFGDFEKIPDAEIIIEPSGKVTWSGIQQF